MGKDKTNVEAEVKLEILKMKDDIISAVTTAFTASNTKLEQTLREHYDLRLGHLEKEQSRSFDHHREHFKSFLSLKESENKDHNDIKNYISNEIGTLRTVVEALKERQSKDEGMEAGKDKTNAFINNRKTIFWTAAAVIITAAIFLLT